MRNVFIKGVPHSQFVWENIGDIEAGRGTLGDSMPVLVYRLMQHTLGHTLSESVGSGKSDDFFRNAGSLAGTEYAKHVLTLSDGVDEFTEAAQRNLMEFNIGIDHISVVDRNTGCAVSAFDRGAGATAERPICKYEEGLVIGIMDTYANSRFTVSENAYPDEGNTTTGGSTMRNVFMKDIPHNQFTWENIGDIEGGRGELGVAMPVLVYRLMQYTMLDVLSKEFGSNKANDYFRDAGYLAGTQFSKHMLNLEVGLDEFIANLQAKLKLLRIGILRMEAFDRETGEIVLSVGEDLDCSGLPVTDETVCNYDEGFIAGILEAYTGKRYDVREIDCWANGDRVCRFNGKVKAA